MAPGVRGERLEIGLAADRNWRAERRAKWDRRLQQVDRLEGGVRLFQTWMILVFCGSTLVSCLLEFAPSLAWAAVDRFFLWVSVAACIAALYGDRLFGVVVPPLCRWIRRRVTAAALRDSS